MKLLGWVSKLFAAAILISFLSVGTTAYLVDQYVKAILERWQLNDVARPSLHLGDWFASMINADRLEQTNTGTKDLMDDTSIEEPDSVPPKGAVEATSSPASEPERINPDPDGAAAAKDSLGSDAAEESEDSMDSVKMENSLPVFGQSNLTDSLVMSAEEFNEKRKKLTDQDQLDIFTIMMNKLPQSELQKMSELLEDGITEEELRQLEDVINAYLHENDVARLLSILNKY